MKNNLIEKIKLLPEKEKNVIVKALTRLRNMEIDSPEAESFIKKIKNLEKNVKVLQIDKRNRLVFTTNKDDQGEMYMLMLDLIQIEPQSQNSLTQLTAFQKKG